MNQYKIMLVDDEPAILDLLERALNIEGFYNITKIDNGLSAVTTCREMEPDVMVLDVMLPDIDGYEVCKQIREFSHCPVLFLSSKNDELDKILGLAVGGDDYVTKPFELRELLARIAVQLRLRPASAASSVLTLGGLSMDSDTHTVTASGSEVHLTRTEYAILKLLLKNPSQVITKSLLLDRISEDTPDCTDNSLKMHVSNLRRKLREADGKDYIEAVWGIGFKMRSEET